MKLLKNGGSDVKRIRLSLLQIWSNRSQIRIIFMEFEPDYFFMGFESVNFTLDQIEFASNSDYSIIPNPTLNDGLRN